MIIRSDYTIIVKGCGDYEFLSRMFGISGASGMHAEEDKVVQQCHSRSLLRHSIGTRKQTWYPK